MSMPNRAAAAFAAAVALLLSGIAGAEEVRVAVAANFAGTAETIARAFEARSDDTVSLIVGSTGKLAAQAQNGAPFDVFLAADTGRPEALVEDGTAVPGSLFTYAIGRLVLLAPESGDPEARLREGDFRHLAIANPKTAPYGEAAVETLRHLELGGLLDDRRLVTGKSVGQTYGFCAKGAADLCFVALSQVGGSAPDEGTIWEVPQDAHGPIVQAAVLLSPGGEKPAATAFLSFLRSDVAQAGIVADGYALP